MSRSIGGRVRRILYWLGLALLVSLPLFLLLTWAPDRPLAALTQRWAPTPSTFLDIDGLSVHLRDEGNRADPSPVLLLHGTSSSLHTWEGWTQALLPRHRVIRCDLPGFGLTGPRSDGNYTFDAYVRFLVALLNRLGVERCTVGGNSFGGALAFMLALEHPERVDRLVLVDAVGYPSVSQSVPIGFRIAGIPVLNQLMKKVLPRRLIRSSLENVYGDPSKVNEELIERYFELTLREGNRRALVERFRQAKPGYLSERIPEIAVPTLILWGARDRLIPPENGEHFHRDIAGSELRIFEGLGHVPHEEDPAATVAVLRAFLEAS